MAEPIICFGQQPNGFFPKRYFYSKILSARRLQQQIGGKIMYFFHDSDSDYRETVTVLIDKQSGKEARLNFEQENKIQKKFSPLYAKKIPAGWQEKTLRLLPQYIEKPVIDVFASIQAPNAAAFCLEMYKKMGLLEGIEVVPSSNPELRTQAANLKEPYYVDLPYEGEIVRAKYENGKLKLHEGGEKYIELAETKFEKSQINPGRDQRMEWMQSIIHATHYIMGAGEAAYLNTAAFPEVNFIKRDEIESPDHAWIG